MSKKQRARARKRRINKSKGMTKFIPVPPIKYTDDEKNELLQLSKKVYPDKDLVTLRKEVEVMIEQTETNPCFINNLYQVNIREEYNDFVEGNVVQLLIKRRDKHPIHNWRHFQQIKNELVGPENEGIELYPAESRLIDTANQYHLWVIADPTKRIKIGYDEGRLVHYKTLHPNTKQRKRETN